MYFLVYQDVDVYLHFFLTLTLLGHDWLTSCLSCLTAGIKVGSWVGLRDCLDGKSKRNIYFPYLERRAIFRSSSPLPDSNGDRHRVKLKMLCSYGNKGISNTVVWALEVPMF